VERLGKLELTSVVFRDEAHLRHIIERIISRVGRRIDESTPLVDARLPDGSRVNAIIPPAALDGPILSIRRFRRRALSIEDLLAVGSLTPEIAQMLTGACRARLNMLITGGTGSGKTTVLNIMSRYIPNEERIVTIEDSAELMLQQPHVVRLETRPPNIEGKGQITQRDLVKNALRMRPDRIVVGEVRGDEVLDMLQAMNTGHDGSMTTLHSNGPRDALHRMENLVLMAGHNLPDRAIREQIASSIELVVHVSRMSDGSRKVLSIQELLGMEGPIVTMQEIFHFVQTGLSPEGKVKGHFEATGIVPRCSDRVRMAGVELPTEIFERGRRL
ncbi:MAG TPA: CpaF family protein, partial [Candidatus Limnocylindria bacterium]|nr:CpaF family protein [Candidatus Limnocylindria bacterium]